MKKFNRADFEARKTFPTKEVKVDGLGVVTIQKMSARNFNEYLAAATGKSKKPVSDGELVLMMIKWSVVDEDKNRMFTDEDDHIILDNMSGEQLQYLSSHIMFFNGMGKDPDEPKPEKELAGEEKEKKS